MDKFIVSARKYRPQEFDTVVGQMHITTTLKNAIKNNQLAHAFLFCGPRGVGKTTCARILAKTINCTNLQPDGEACNQCSSCKSFNDGASLNIHELDAASNNSVDDIRELVSQVRFAPQAGKYKIYIVDEVHMLSTSAFNAFLKTLEEPPSYAIFILATTEKHKILPTILSRCQIFDFKRITTNDTVEHLLQIATKENINTDKASLQIIAQKSEGCMRDALSILDKIVSFTNGEVNYQNTIEHLNILDHDYYFKLLGFLQQQQMAEAMLLYDEINRKGFEGDTVLNGFAEFVRNILVCKDAKAAQLLDVVEGMQEKYFSTATNITTAFLVSTLNILNEAEVNFKMARNKKLHVELAIIKLNFLHQAISLSVDGNTVVKKKQLNEAVAIKFKPIPSIQIKPKEDAKLFVEASVQPIKTKPQTTSNNSATEFTPTHNNQLLVSSEVLTLAEPEIKIQKVEALPNSKDLLAKLRKQVGDKYTVEEIAEAESLQLEKLQNCITNYILVMEKQGGKTTTMNVFKMARVQIIDDLKFILFVNTLTSQRAVEQEKLAFAELVQKAFNNTGINFSVLVDASAEDDKPQPVVLNTRQRYEILSQKYPMLKVLKETLKLDLEM